MITVLGATGYIGSNLVRKLTEAGTDFFAPGRNEDLAGRELGHIIYCIGLTADFRTKPFETAEAHVCMLNRVLAKYHFESLTYLSSARVYIHSGSTVAKEEDMITVNPLDPGDLYTLTKLTGERLCLSSGKNVKIVRLSNIIGRDPDSGNFLSSVIHEIKEKGTVTLATSASSAKDYLFIDDAVKLILDISLSGREKIYNLAAGCNTSNGEILNELKKQASFSCTVAENAKEIIFPRLDTEKIKNEFNFNPIKITEVIPGFFKTI